MLLLSFSILICAGTVSAADTIYVNNNTGNDSWDGLNATYDPINHHGPKISIKNATGTVNQGGTIHIANGTYTGENNTKITIDKNMTIIGESQIGTVINGTNINWIFQINPGLNVTIQNLTITNAFGHSAIFNQGNLTVENCKFTNNHQINNPNTNFDGGSSICNYANSGSITVAVANCTFTDNLGNRGSIFNYCNGGVSVLCAVTNCNFTGNNAPGGMHGGAIGNYASTGYVNCTMNNCMFTDNTAGMWGGAIINFDNDGSKVDCTINNSSFINNHAGRGGAITCYSYGSSSNCVITNCNFINNVASYGGAIYNQDGYNLIAHFNRFYNNTVPTGSAIYRNGGSMDVENNWWGTNRPDTNWSSLIYGFNHPNWWIYMNLTANPLFGNNITLTADFNHLYNGTDITPLTNGHIPNSVVNFASNDGSLNLLSKTTMEGLASSIFTPNHLGSVTVNATLDDQICSLTFNVDKMPTNLTIGNLSGNNGKTVTLNATLTDHYGTPLNNKTVEFYVNNVKIGENSTDTNGVATFNYNISQMGGIYNITAKFLEDSGYLASTANGTLKVNQSSVYVNVTTSKNNPTAGKTITLTFKLGNNGPDPADDVIFTYVIPEVMEFVSIETEPGYPEATYNATTRTITWPLGTVPKLDPWIKLNVLVLNSGAFNIISGVTTSTYDPNLGSNIQQITINAVQAASATSVTSSTRTIGMQKTGIPINYLILAILAVFGGLIIPKRK